MRIQLLSALCLMTIDQIIKQAITSSQLPWILNTGGAWGIGAELSHYHLLHFIGTAVIATLWYKQKDIFPLNWGIVLILTGAVSNGIDRIVRQGVIDFLHPFNWFPWFNFADVYINIGVVIIVIVLLKDTREGYKDSLSV